MNPTTLYHYGWTNNETYMHLQCMRSIDRPSLWEVDSKVYETTLDLGLARVQRPVQRSLRWVK